jgi:hypothetical protein
LSKAHLRIQWFVLVNPNITPIASQEMPSSFSQGNFTKENNTEEEERMITENLDLKQKMEEMSKKIQFLEGKIKYLEDKLEHQPVTTPIDTILKDMDTETSLEWYGVTSFNAFHATVFPHLQNYHGFVVAQRIKRRIYKRKMKLFIDSLCSCSPTN